MPFDIFNQTYRASRWKGKKLAPGFECKVSELREHLPEFAWRPFGDPPNDNPRMRTIVRMPTLKDPYERPVAVVTEHYELLQHQVMSTWIAQNLSDLGLGNVTANVTMSEYGERVRVNIPLGGHEIPSGMWGEKEDMFRPEIEVINSVDKSAALSVLVRLRRIECLNGMFTNQEDRMRSIHRSDLARDYTISDFLKGRLQGPFLVFEELQRWKNTPVTVEMAKDWCEGWLRSRSGWTVENCARLWAIVSTGYDGEVKRPRNGGERHPLSDYHVGQHKKVPGINTPILTAFDVSQILTWITSNQRSIEMQIEGTEDVPKLMRNLLGD